MVSTEAKPVAILSIRVPSYKLATRALFFLAAPLLFFALDDLDRFSPFSSKLFTRPNLGLTVLVFREIGVELLWKDSPRCPVFTMGPLADLGGAAFLMSLLEDGFSESESPEDVDIALLDRPGGLREDFGLVS